MLERWVDAATAFGFSHAGPLRADTLWLRPEVRDMCSVDRCRKYGRSWMCPPACGSLEENHERIKPYTDGIIVQTTAELEDDFDYETMEAAGAKQKELFLAFRRELAKEFSGLLALTSGGCDLCEVCTYPDAPCIHPEDAMPSMEAFGLVVSDVCQQNDLPYYYGPGTITYTGCYLLR